MQGPNMNIDDCVSYAVRRPCSDFMNMLRRLTSCRIIIIIIIIIFFTPGSKDPGG